MIESPNPNFKVTIEPQLYALVLHENKPRCVPIVVAGNQYRLFPADVGFDVICFGHASKLTKAFKRVEGALEEYEEYRHANLAQMFFSLASDVFIAFHYLEMIGETETEDQIILQQQFVDFMVYICGELREAGVHDVNIATELQRYLGTVLSQMGMVGLMYQIAPLLPRILSKFADKSQITETQSASPDENLDYMSIEFLEGLFGDEEEEDDDDGELAF